ncbi:MAG: tRNA 2-thiouridine(34) synthase MnmA [Prevotellaceae bacterium]|jgi:tRNA-specific 2-thiouridylase|nr:tRNA 2-thiouridine(34) synthase MnmA [Prevotellaceae bacterium]
MSNNKVLLGMSGGTDSSVAVLLLQDAGYEVTGVTFRFWEEEGKNEYLKDAEELAAKTGIRHYALDVRDDFQREIISYFTDEYLQGRTPVPCVRCNNLFKWRLLYEEAQRLQIEHIGTGHYAIVKKHNDLYYIHSGTDPDKDQSFFLWGLEQHVLQKMVLPLGEYTKKQVREIAAKRGFQKVAARKDSMGVCFCPGDYRSFLLKMLPQNQEIIRPGNFVDDNGLFVGRHRGYPFYTVGQRRKLDIQFNYPVFVKEIIPEKNQVVLAKEENMYLQTMFLKDWVLQNSEEVIEKPNIIVKIRYKKQHNYGMITYSENNLLKVVFDQPVAAIAPGQAACFYISDRVAGGGIIV